MEFCNGGTLRELMEAKDWNISPIIIKKIMYKLTNGLNDMMENLIIHRDIKLDNIMLHFPEKNFKSVSKEER